MRTLLDPDSTFLDDLFPWAEGDIELVKALALYNMAIEEENGA